MNQLLITRCTANRHEFKELKAIHNLVLSNGYELGTANRHEFKELKAIHNQSQVRKKKAATANRHEFKELKAIHNRKSPCYERVANCESSRI